MAPLDESGVALSTDLYLIAESKTLDALIERDAPEARYFVGVVSWASGELAVEVAQGLWRIEAIESDDVLNALPRGDQGGAWAATHRGLRLPGAI